MTDYEIEKEVVEKAVNVCKALHRLDVAAKDAEYTTEDYIRILEAKIAELRDTKHAQA